MSDQLCFEDREDDLRLRSVWNVVLDEVAMQVPAKMADRFVFPLRPIRFSQGQVLVETASAFSAEWIKNRCLSELQIALSKALDEPVVVNLRINPNERKTTNHTEPSVRLSQPIAERREGAFEPVERFSFANFVVGPSNRLAYAGANAVAQEPGKKFNPLFVYGPSGLGKTHLLHAIARELMTRDPNVVVAYLSAQQFTEDFVAAMQKGKIDQFRRQHRNVHVWLVDDVQFLAGKERTQEEIFYIFNALQQTGRQIVLCSDRSPRELYLMDERLRSRFESGLVADIQTPDTETRCAILRQKASLEGVALSLDVAMYLAENVVGNVRVLEGALTKILAESSLLSLQVDIDFAKQLVETHYSKPVVSRPTVAQILEVVSNYYGIPIEEIRGQSRKAPIALARHVAAYMTRELTGDSWKHIGAQFGDRDHTSMMHAYQRISEAMLKDKDFAQTVKTLTRNLRPNL